MTKFSIVTPCLNGERYISETVKSIVNNRSVQSGHIELQYIVVDGGSSDLTLDMLSKELARAPGNVQAIVISEPDQGMYHALAKGLRLVDGDVVGYLNAGDYYSPTAFEIVEEIFGRGETDWLTGLTVIYSDRSDIIDVKLPYRYRNRLLRAGFYGRFLPYIQQESTFWSAGLQDRIDLDRLSNCRLAGDFFIWRSLSEFAQLSIVEAWLAGFRVHSGQLSEDIEKYLDELRRLCTTPKPLDYVQAAVDRMLWLLPNRPKKILNSDILAFEPESGCYAPVRGARAGPHGLRDVLATVRAKTGERK